MLVCRHQSSSVWDPGRGDAFFGDALPNNSSQSLSVYFPGLLFDKSSSPLSVGIH